MKEFAIGTTDAIIIGQKSESVFLFLHGNGGSKEEAIAFTQVVVPHGYQVVGIDLPVMDKPWIVLKKLEAVKEFLKRNYKSISIRANSIGAWFSMLAFNGEEIDQALFVSPLLDMKVFIERMPERDEDYYNWVILHPIDQWNAPTFILRPENDGVIDASVYESFLANHDCNVEIAEEGEHWFHTPRQLEVMKRWEESVISKKLYSETNMFSD